MVTAMRERDWTVLGQHGSFFEMMERELGQMWRGQ
jgi:hypothetical protein